MKDVQDGISRPLGSRGIQKTKVSSLLVITLSILNILFSSFFVLTLNLDVFGVALGTLFASYITLIIFTSFTYSFIIKKFKIIPRFEKLIVKSNFHCAKIRC